MVLVDKKILVSGIVMIAFGLSITIYLDATIPIGRSGMTEEETLDLFETQQQNQDMRLLSGIVAGIGFLLVLISFGARRKRKGGIKTIEKKPAT
jgi:dolichol kinase